MIASNCVLAGPYTAGVDRSFGQALQQVLGGLKLTAIAQRALGERATKKRVRDFANYISRIAHDHVPNVGLDKLRLIAKGLDLSLSSFFARIEALQTTANPSDNQVGSPTLTSTGVLRDEATTQSAPPKLEYVTTRYLGDEIRTLRERVQRLEQEAAAARREQATDRDAETIGDSRLHRRPPRRPPGRAPARGPGKRKRN